MEPTDTILTSGFRLGRMFRVTWRLNFLFPIVTLALMWRMQDMGLGLLAGGVLLFSVILHELSHLVVSRSIGGDMDRIHLWPLGGLSHPYGRGYLTDHARVLFAGPCVNLIVALSCMTRLTEQQVTDFVQHFTLNVSATAPLTSAIVPLMFAANLMLCVVNLLPVVPFDAGVLLRTYLTDRFSEVESRDLMIRSGLVLGTFSLLLGYVFDLSTVMLAATFVVVLHTHESMRWLEMLTDLQLADEPALDSDTISFPEPDVDEWSEFESPLLSLSKLDSPDDELLASECGQQFSEETLDQILEKLHQHGRSSLTDLELDLLEQLSNQIRQRRSSL